MTLFDAALPESWAWQPLGRHYRITKRPRGLNYAMSDRIPFAPMEAVPAGGSARIQYEFREPGAISSGTYFERGDILLARITPSFENGKQGRADDLPKEFGVGSTELTPLQPIASADPWYLFYYLLHPEVREFLAGKMEGSTARQRVPEQALLDLPVPTPPPEEQAAIAAALQLVQRARELEERKYVVLGELLGSSLNDLMTGRLRIADLTSVGNTAA